MEMNHALLNACGVGHPRLEEIRLLLKSHQIAFKLTGAGGGGFGIALIPSGHFINLGFVGLNRVMHLLEEAGFTCFETNLGVPGVQRVQCADHDIISNLFLSRSFSVLDAFFINQNHP